jgi:hypothetical protein
LQVAHEVWNTLPPERPRHTSPGCLEVRAPAVRVVVERGVDDVPTDQDRVDLVLDGILDIVEESLKIQTEMARPGVAGCAVVQGRVTEILSLPDLVAAAGARAPAAQAA